MLQPEVLWDALGNTFLQVMSPGLRGQVGPGAVVTHVAVLRGTPMRDPDTARGAGREQEAVGMEAEREAAEGRKNGKALCEAAP